MELDAVKEGGGHSYEKTHTFDLSKLPSEVLEAILCQLDVVTFVKSHQVNHKWRTCANCVESRTSFWREKSFQEIDKTVLIQILGGPNVLCDLEVSEEYARPSKWEFWKDVYRDFYRSRFVGVWNQILIHHTPEQIGRKKTDLFSIGLSGSYIFTQGVFTTNNLTVCNVNIHDEAGESLQPIYNHYSLCEAYSDEICAWDFHHKLAVNSLPSSHSSLHHAVIGLKNGYILMVTFKDNGCAKKLCKPSSTCSRLVGVRIWSDYLVIANQDSLVVMKLETNKEGVLVWDQLCYIKGHHNEPQSCIGVWDNKVVSGSYGGELVFWDFSQSLSGKCHEDTQVLHCFDKPIYEIVFRDKILVAITEFGNVDISIDGGHHFETHNALMCLSAPACKLALRGNLFAIATTIGHVYMYHFETVEDFGSLSLKQHKTVIKTGHDSIKSVAISDNDVTEGPMVTIATAENHVFVVHWLFPDTETDESE